MILRTSSSVRSFTRTSGLDPGRRQDDVRAVTPDAEDIRETDLDALGAREIDT